MAQTTTARHEEASRGYPGWRVVAVCFVLATFSWAFGFYGQGVYVAQLAAIHGWPVSTLASAATAYYLTSAVLVAFAGDVVQRLGPRAVIAVGVLFLAAGAFVTGRAGTLGAVYAGYGMIACGWAATSIAAITSAIGIWFTSRRGLAISLALNGASLGGVLGAPALVWASERYGFASALAGMSALMVVVVGAMLLVVWPASPPPLRPPRDAGMSASSRRLALRSRRFWTMSTAFAAGLFVQVGFVVHLVALVAPVAGPQGGGLAVSLLAVAAVVGRLALGVFVDRIDAGLASAGSLFVQAAALLIVVGSDGHSGLLAGSILFGLSVGNLITLPSIIVHREWPAGDFATVISLSTAIGQFAYAFGPGAIGWLRDATGGYGVPLAICAAVDAVAAMLVLVGRTRPLTPSSRPP